MAVFHALVSICSPLEHPIAGITTTYDDHLIIVGDAAGFIDPLTGARPAQMVTIARHGRYCCCGLWVGNSLMGR